MVAEPRTPTMARCTGCGTEHEARYLIRGMCGNCHCNGVVVHTVDNPSACANDCGGDALGICNGRSTCTGYRA